MPAEAVLRVLVPEGVTDVVRCATCESVLPEISLYVAVPGVPLVELAREGAEGAVDAELFGLYLLIPLIEQHPTRIVHLLVEVEQQHLRSVS